MGMGGSDATDAAGKLQDELLPVCHALGGCHACHNASPTGPIRLAALFALLLNSGCSNLSESVNPVSWWHGLQGGAIAEQRPPPPNADAPYPKLGTVPPKPAPPDPALRQKIAGGLLADRTNAQYVASQNPIVVPPPTVVTTPKPVAPNPDALSASLEAASAPPPPPAPPPKPAAPIVAAVPTSGATTQAAISPPVAAGPPPNIPAAPPAAPVLPGIDIPITAPTPPPKAPPVAVVVPTLSEEAKAPVPVPFAPGSAVLPPGADGPLKRLAARRANKVIDIIGFGEATDTQPQVQTAALSLGLARARAIAAVLTGVGVPVWMLRIDAQAAGVAADARLVD